MAAFNLLNATIGLLVGCQELSSTGVHLFTPDASNSYGAQWTRDFAYMLQYAPDAVASSAAVTGANVTAAVAYTLDAITAEGWVPDRVTASGQAIFAPGVGWPIKLAWDNMPFAGLLLAGYTRGWLDDPFFCRYEATARAALQAVPLVNGLAWNNPAAPNCSYGFIDSVVLEGRMLFVSLLMADAARQLSALSKRTGCGGSAAAEYYDALAAGVAGAVDSLYDASSGLFLACDGAVDSLPDVWGSAYLASLGLSTPQRRAGVADWIAAAWRASNASAANLTVWQQGQLRHLPQPLVWQRCIDGTCPAPGTYQDGAFWATPLAWTVPVLAAGGYPDVAAGVLQDALASFTAGGVMECVNDLIKYTGVRDYVASGTNALAALQYLQKEWP